MNKWPAVAAQTTRSRCKVLSIQYVYYFRAYQRQGTLHGVGVITKLYFAIFAAFNESMTLNLAPRSFKVIDFGTNRKRVYTFLLVVNSNLDAILHRFRDTAAYMSKIDNFNFPYPTPIPAKIWGCFLWSRSVILGSAEKGKVRLISREIIFQEFQLM